MKRLLFLLFTLCSTAPLLHGTPSSREPYEGFPVEKITVAIEYQKPGEVDETSSILRKIETKEGNPFDQEVFDRDLKLLNQTYDWIEPQVEVRNDLVYIHLVVQKKPTISRFIVEGSKLSQKEKKKLLKSGELKSGMEYDRETFYKSLNKIREFLIKKGFFQSDVAYRVERDSDNKVTVYVLVNRGPYGRLNNIRFEGFTNREKRELATMIRPRKYNVIYSWLTGAGTVRQEDFDSDIQVIVHHMQNKGYVDAHVTMSVEQSEDSKCILVIHLDRGPKYHFHHINFSGFTLHNEEELRKASLIKAGDLFSIDQIRSTQEKIRELYTQDGYLQTNVDYTLTLLPDQSAYDVQFTVEESEQYRIGLVLVSGNYCTNKSVVYNNINLEPGDVFDSRKIKSTQQRLQSTGFFKNVNVYPIKADEGSRGSSEYCDVMVEVDEAQTGNASLFVGASSTDSVFGGLDLTENNFSLAGFRNVWTRGPSAFRGGGQFFKMKGTIGQKESGANISWVDPYFNNTLWRLGVDVDYVTSTILTNNYRLNTVGGQVSALYPFTRSFVYGYKFRVKDSFNTILKPAVELGPIESKEAKNSGVGVGFAVSFGYDTTDNPFRPRKGLRSNFETEIVGLVRTHLKEWEKTTDDFHDTPFLKFGYINSYYHPLWKAATLKLRLDLKFIQLLKKEEKSRELPLTEKFFLGGENTVRGYANGQVGPVFQTTNDPKGGITSMLGSIEVAQNVVKPLDVFTFFDAGTISKHSWHPSHIRMSVGAGVRLDIGKRLPFVVGIGYPLNPRSLRKGPEEQTKEVQMLFFSMAGQF